MQHITARTIFYLLIDLFLLVVCFLNAPSVLERARVPFHVQEVNDSIIVTDVEKSTAGGLQAGDQILKWNSYEIVIPELVVEYLGDLSSIGQKVNITFTRNNIESAVEVTMVPFYPSARFLVVTFCVGFVIWLIGVFVIVYRSGSSAAPILHWALIVFAVSIMLTWGRVDSSSLLPFIARGLFFACYTLIGSLFFIFSINYPKERKDVTSRYAFLVFLPAIILIAGQTYYHLQAISFTSVQAFVAFQYWFDAFNVFLFVMVGATIYSLISSYTSTIAAEDKRRLEWILWGFCVSPIPFLLLVKLPQLFGISSGLIPEEFTTIFFLLIPFSFTVSLVKYNILDIQLVINRSIAYAALTVFTGVVYTLAVLLVATSFDREQKFKEYFFIAIIIFLTGIVLNPVRRRLQIILDEALFPARVNFRKSIVEAREKLSKCITQEDAFNALYESIIKTIPLERLCCYAYASGKLVLKASTNDTSERVILIDEEKVINQENYESINDFEYLKTATGCSLHFPIVGESKTLLGILGAIPAKTIGRLSKEEIDLTTALCSDAGETMDRLLLQEKMIIQIKEKERFEELSNLKSYFVSSVSHELRTPLTSIRMFTELLDSGKNLSLKQRKEYLNIISGESERLSRLVNDVLDFAKIERGEKEYRFEPVNLPDVIRKAVHIMQYQFTKQKGILKASIAKNIPVFYGDADALEEALINLLSNGLKYSGKKIFVQVAAKRLKDKIMLQVIDRGVGIPETELDNIFEKFYRIRSSQRQSGGAGLGLALVKHIVEAHGGTITVKSIVGKGSTFTILLPITQRSAL